MYHAGSYIWYDAGMKKSQKLTLDSEVFSRAVEDVVTREQLAKLLASRRQLRIKHGIDATSPDLHIGHATSLWKIRAMQDAGHRAVILLGDATTAIGDPTGRSRTRPALSGNEIHANMKSIERQLAKILLTDKNVFELRRSSEWYAKMRAPEFLQLSAMVTHARLIERDMFQERMRRGEEIFIHELLYPILQGYDSVMLRSDLTIIGSDQLFNEHMGRFLQEKFGQSPQVIVALKILPGLGGGEKMSKSQGNYIALDDTPQDKFGKTMRVLDSLIISYMGAYTDMSLARIGEWERGIAGGKNPMEAKLALAEALVARYHGPEAGRREQERFLALFSARPPTGIGGGAREVPADIPLARVASLPGDVIDILVEIGFASSRSAARRLVRQGAVAVDGAKVVRERYKEVREGNVIKVGRRIAKVFTRRG